MTRSFAKGCGYCQVHRRMTRPPAQGAVHRDRVFAPKTSFAWYVDVAHIRPRFTITEFNFVLIFVEETTKFVVLRGFKNYPTTADVKFCARQRILNHIFGVPRHFRSDRGPGFNGVVDDASLDKWLRINYGSTWIVGTPYNHNAQHLAERYCRIVKERKAKSHVDGTWSLGTASRWFGTCFEYGTES